MKISIITTITNPEENQYPWREAINSYLALADEVIVVNGSGSKGIVGYHIIESQVDKLKFIHLPWPNKWHWSELPIHLNAGLEQAIGDWVIKCDIDYVFHENDIKDIRFALENNAKQYSIASFVKKIIIDRNSYFKKCRIPVAIHKGQVGDSIKFGIDPNLKSDWCMPILVKGEKRFIASGTSDYIVPTGQIVPPGMVYDTGLNIYNYDCFFRTKEVQKREFWRFAQAYASAFDESWGSSEEEAFSFWTKMMKSRLSKQLYPMDIESHPEFIKEKIKNMKPEEFGFNNWKGE